MQQYSSKNPQESQEQERGFEPKPKQEQPTPETEKQEMPKPKEMEKPEVPKERKPEIPQGEKIPSGGPAQAQPTTQATTTQPKSETEAKKRKLAAIKGQLKKPIPIGTPQEREVSGKLEDYHSNNILGQS